jgi:hypothetical protein
MHALFYRIFNEKRQSSMKTFVQQRGCSVTKKNQTATQKACIFCCNFFFGPFFSSRASLLHDLCLNDAVCRMHRRRKRLQRLQNCKMLVQSARLIRFVSTLRLRQFNGRLTALCRRAPRSPFNIGLYPFDDATTSMENVNGSDARAVCQPGTNCS